MKIEYLSFECEAGSTLFYVSSSVSWKLSRVSPCFQISNHYSFHDFKFSDVHPHKWSAFKSSHNSRHHNARNCETWNGFGLRNGGLRRCLFRLSIIDGKISSYLIFRQTSILVQTGSDHCNLQRIAIYGHNMYLCTWGFERNFGVWLEETEWCFPEEDCNAIIK